MSRLHHPSHIRHLYQRITSLTLLRRNGAGQMWGWALLAALSLWLGVGLFQGLPVLRAQSDDRPTHEVRTGETLSEIAAAYGVTLADLMALNGISDPNQIVIGQSLLLPANAIRIGQPTITLPTHTVGAGETLSEIAKRYGVSQTRLMFLNGIADADAIVEGQILRLPAIVETTAPPTAAEEEERRVTATATRTPTAPADETTASKPATGESQPGFHTVVAGETLSEIAQQYSVTLQALMAENSIRNADAIIVGQELRIPGSPTATVTDTATPEASATVEEEQATPTATVTDTATPEASATVEEQATPTQTPGEEGSPTGEVESTPEASATPGEAETPEAGNIASLNHTYTVERNDTIASIARDLGVDRDALQRINGIRTNNDLSMGQELIVPATADDLRVERPNDQYEHYVVQAGDSLSVIAKQFGRSLAEVMTANYIGNPDTITVGQTLLIPKPPADQPSEQRQIKRIGPERNGYLYYTVQQGDTLSQVAKDFDSTLLALLDYNSLPNVETVYRGLELRIPFGSPPLPVQLPPTPTSGSSFLVSLSRQECWLFWGKQVHRHWRCSTGYGEFVTRTGNFAVQSKIENAKSNAYRLDMPYWLGIYNVGEYENGIHGLPVSWDTGKKIWTSLVGQPATFGCAMLGDEDAATLYQAAYVGMPVYIVN